MRILTMGLLAVAAALPPSASGQADRVVILVRHAEAAGEPTRDPPLTDAGRGRTAALAAAVAHTGLDAVVVTPYRRTRDTAEPLALARGLTPVVVEVAGGLDAHVTAVADTVRAQAPGATVLVVGHSNTVPAIVAALGGPRLPDLCHAEYAWLFTLVLPADGPARLIRSSYGTPDPPDAGSCRAEAGR